MRHFILSMLEPLTKFVGKIGVRSFKIKYKTAQIFDAMARDGDVILTFKPYQATNLFIKGKLKHASIFIGNGEVVEATSEGVHISSIYDLLMSEDHAVLMRRVPDAPEIAKEASGIALSLVGLPYDYEGEDGDDEYYCSEVVKKSYSIKKDGLLLPNDIYEDRKNWVVIYEV